MSILEIKGLGKNFYLHHANREIHSCENINFSLGSLSELYGVLVLENLQF